VRCSPPGSGYSPRTAEATRNIARGGYVLSEAGGKPSAVIIATGSEVQLAVGAQKVLGEQGIAVRVVSMPSTSVFVRQDAAYRESVLPKTVRRIAVEAYCRPSASIRRLTAIGVISCYHFLRHLRHTRLPQLTESSAYI
jgi:transketolase